MYGQHQQLYHAISNTVIFVAVAYSCVLTYGDSYASLELELSVRCIFWMEVAMKVIAESNRPWLYWTGTNKLWNWFDFSLCVILFLFPSASYIRALRFVKPLWSLDLLEPLLAGILNIASDIFCVVIVLGLVMFMYASIAVSLLSQNDPLNFNNMITAMTSLFKIATNEGWEDMFLVSYRGCDKVDYSMSPFPCTTPKPQPAIAILFFFTYSMFSLVQVLILVTVISSSVSMVTKAINLENTKKRHEESTAKGLWVSRLYWRLQERSIVYADMQNKCALVLLNMFEPSRGSAGETKDFRVCAANRSRLTHRDLPKMNTDASGKPSPPPPTAYIVPSSE